MGVHSPLLSIPAGTENQGERLFVGPTVDKDSVGEEKGRFNCPITHMVVLLLLAFVREAASGPLHRLSFLLLPEETTLPASTEF